MLIASAMNLFIGEMLPKFLLVIYVLSFGWHLGYFCFWGVTGIADLRITNKCLLSKWLFKLLNEDDTRQTLLRNKYLSLKCLSQVKIKHGDSHFWKGLLNSIKDFLGCGTFEVKDGSQTRFWEDIWVGSKPLKEQFPNLYNIVYYPHVTVANVMN